MTSLVCRIDNHPDPITLAVEATFKVAASRKQKCTSDRSRSDRSKLNHANAFVVICHLGIFVKGPTVTLNVPSVDFGLLKLGERKRTPLLLTNITQLEASWTLEESQDAEDSQVPTSVIIVQLG